MDEPRRIIDLTETQLVGSGDYLALDSADGGTKKVKASYFSGGSENYMWGGIQGDIADQTDLYEYLEQLPEKANIDGYYEDMSVGSAEQLLSNTYEPDNTPYLYRTSGGSLEIGDRVYEDAVVGVSIPWNQLVPSNKKSGTITPDGTTNYILNPYMFSMTDNRTTLFSAKIKYNGATALASIWIQTSTDPTYARPCQTLPLSDINSGKEVTLFWIAKRTVAWTGTGLGYSCASGTTLLATDTLDYDNVQQFDLTLALGSTIADYVYTLETSEAGSGIAWLKSQGFFTKDYYPYNAGQMMSVKTSAKKVVGFNQWDEVWENGGLNGSSGTKYTSSTRIVSKNFIPVLPNTKYYIKAPTQLSFAWYDADKNYISGQDGATANYTRTSPNNAYYFMFSVSEATYGNNICINLHWDGEKDGEYEAYVEHTYPLDSELELRGIPKLDSANKLYYDGDTYESDGTVTRRFGIVDLGTLTWHYSGSGPLASVTDGTIYNTAKKPSSNNILANIICNKYVCTSRTNVENMDGSIALNSSNVIVLNDTAIEGKTAEQIKTAMSGVYLVYELATPTTESADPYTSPQLVDNWGTEEFVDTRDVPVPVGHDSRYLPDLKAKLESAPNNPSTNGKYFLQYQNGEATYVPVPSEVPQTPSEDGSYVLKATVSGGTATLSWVAEE